MAAASSSGPQPRMTPSRVSRSSRACTVPRATPRRREHSSTPMRGSAANRPRMRPSSASRGLPVDVVMVSTSLVEKGHLLCRLSSVSTHYCACCPRCASIMATPTRGEPAMTTDTAAHSTLALTDEERLAELDLESLQQLVGLVDYDATTDPFPVTGWDAV